MSNQDYCVYLTIYKGNKLPPFYIGSSSVKRIQKGYKGTPVSKLYKNIWLKEKKFNVHLFDVKIISFHKTRSDASKKEVYLQKQLNVKDNALYINMGYWNNGHLVYSKSREALRVVANKRRGYKHSEETKKKISIAHLGRKHTKETRDMWKDGRRKGKNNHQFGKSLTEEHKNKIRQKQLGVPCPQRARYGRPSTMKGKNLSKETKIKMSKLIWEITIPGKSPEIVFLLAEWCLKFGYRYDCVRPAFLKKGSYKGIKGKLVP